MDGEIWSDACVAREDSKAEKSMRARGGEGIRLRERRRWGVRLGVVVGGVVAKGRGVADRDMAG